MTTMHNSAFQFMITALITSAAFAQQMQDRTFRFAHVQSSAEIQEVVAVIRAIGNIEQITAGSGQPSITIHATAGQIALAEWLVNELDGASNRSPISREYRMPDAPGDIVRVFYLSASKSVPELQEVATLIRATTEIPRLFTFSTPRAVVVRGAEEQIKLADWLVSELDRAPTQSSGKREYRMPGRPDGVVRVFYLAPTNTVQELQEAATMIRALVEIRRMFTYNAPKAMVVRGTEEQIKTAEWLLPDLNRTPNAAPRTYHMTGESEGVVRVFHLKPEVSVRDLQEVATLVRSMSEIRRLFTYNASRAIAVRGTADQVQLAQWLVSELDNPGQATPPEFRMPGDDRVRVFYVTNAGTPERLQQIAVEVRTATAVRRLFTYNAPKAMAVRGTAEQIALADRMVKERNR